MTAINYRKFKLSDQFLDKYKGKQPKWGPVGYITYKSRYARIKEDTKTEEFWETAQRVVEGAFNIQKTHCSNLGLEWNNMKAQKTAQEMYDAIWTFKFLPPGRSLWMMGTEYIENRGAMALMNCAAVTTEDIDRNGARCFAFVMDGLMMGVGMGFDTKGAGKLTIKEPKETESIFVIADSREGWVESVEILLNGYFTGSSIPEFDYSSIRKAGKPLKKFGGVSSGPGALIELHKNLVKLLDSRIGEIISSSDLVDIENYISICVIAGNIRRCLPENTNIFCKDSMKKIKNIKIGDLVLTDKGYKKVINKFDQGKQKTIKIKTQLGSFECTKNHKVAVFDKRPRFTNTYIWKKSEDLVLGDQLVFVKSGDPLLYNKCTNLFTNNFIEIIETNKEYYTYDIEVEESSCFMCSFGVLVHNSASIALGDPFDKEFMALKHDKDKLYSHRYSSNNSINATPGMDYAEVSSHAAKAGEPGIVWLNNMKTRGRFADKKRSDDLAVVGPNPCFTGNMELLTQDGYVKFKDLVGKENLILIGKDGFNYSGSVSESGIKETINLYLSNNVIIKCTPKHILINKTNNEIYAKDAESQLLQNFAGEDIKVLRITQGDTTKVYDFYIDSREHLGIVNGILVHNCGEQQLESMEVCNLVETFPANHDSLEEYLKTLELAYLYAKTVTLLSTHIPETNAIILKNRRIGLSQSGIQQARSKLGTRILFDWCDTAYKYIQTLDNKYSSWLCIPRSKRTTSIKPSGTVSLLVGATPGVHYPESEYYIRRIRFDKVSPFIGILKKAGYKVEQDAYNKNGVVAEFPVKESMFERTKYEVSMWEQLEFVAKYQHYWADNAVSVTVTFTPEEALDIKYALELYEDRLKVVSFLPLGTKEYKQAPYEAITKERYDALTKNLSKLNFKNINSIPDGEKYCDGDSCTM